VAELVKDPVSTIKSVANTDRVITPFEITPKPLHVVDGMEPDRGVALFIVHRG